MINNTKSIILILNKLETEFKALDIKNNNYVSISQRPLVFCKPEQRVKTTKTMPSPKK